MRRNSHDEIIVYKNPAKVFATIVNVTNIPYHLHSSAFEAVCVLRGQVTVYDSALTTDMYENEVHIANRHEIHRITSNDPDNLVLIVQFDSDQYSDLLPAGEVIEFVSGVANVNSLQTSDYRQLRFLMAEIYKNYISSDSSAHMLEQLTRQMIQLLLNNFQSYGYVTSEKGVRCVRRINPGIDDDEFNRIYNILNFLMNHYREKITLDNVAAREFLSPSYVSRYFKKNLGINFSKFIAYVRMYEAAQLLVTTNMSIDMIASETGFASRSHMATLFKGDFGMTPTELRNISRNEIKIETYVHDSPEADKILQRYINGTV